MRPSKQARAHQRWREQEARLIVEALWCNDCGGSGHVPDDIDAGDGPDCHACAARGYSASCRVCAGIGTLRACERCKGEPSLVLQDVLDGERYDVAAVRAYAERLLAEGERLSEEREVFADWTRDRGMGPENRDPWMFGDGECGHCLGSGKAGHGRQGRRVFSGGPCKPCKGRGRVPGGWPGSLAREWGTVECKACEGRGRMLELIDPVHGRAIQRSDGYIAATRWSKCEPCRGRGRLPHPDGFRRAAPNGGAWMVRAARRLLDTLDGRCPWAPKAEAQPGECRRCDGRGARASWTGSGWQVAPNERPCVDCRGTGHNLAGVLPEIEVSEHAVRQVVDALVALREPGEHRGWGRHALADWQAEAYERNRDRIDTMATVLGPAATRVVPRGQHDLHPVMNDWTPRAPRELGHTHQSVTGDGRLMLYAENFGAHEAAWRYFNTLPSWRLGELRHAEQRRRRNEPMLARGDALDRTGVQAGLVREPNEADADYRERILASFRGRLPTVLEDGDRRYEIVPGSEGSTVLPDGNVSLSYRVRASPDASTVAVTIDQPE